MVMHRQTFNTGSGGLAKKGRVGAGKEVTRCFTPRSGPPASFQPPPSSQLPKGEWRRRPGAIDDPRSGEINAQFPLSKVAEDLLFEFYARSDFNRAQKEGIPVDLAAKRILGVSKTRAYEIAEEIYEHEDPDYAQEHEYAPWRWFQTVVLEKMRQKQISRGAETERSGIANAFFTALAGGRYEMDRLADRLRDGPKLDLGKVVKREQDEANKEVLDYLVHSHLLWRS